MLLCGATLRSVSNSCGRVSASARVAAREKCHRQTRAPADGVVFARCFVSYDKWSHRWRANKRTTARYATQRVSVLMVKTNAQPISKGERLREWRVGPDKKTARGNYSNVSRLTNTHTYKHIHIHTSIILL